MTTVGNGVVADTLAMVAVKQMRGDMRARNASLTISTINKSENKFNKGATS